MHGPAQQASRESMMHTLPFRAAGTQRPANQDRAPQKLLSVLQAMLLGQTMIVKWSRDMASHTQGHFQQ